MAEVEIKSIDSADVMCLEFTGSYEQTGDRLDELLAWVLRSGHPWAAAPVGVFYDDPDKVEADKLRAQVAVRVDERCDGDDLVKRKNLPGAEMACLAYEGPIGDIGKAYGELFEWIGANGYRYVEGMGTREIYLRLPEQEAESSGFLIEVQAPVENVSAEQAPAEDAPAEEPAAEEAPAEDAPAEDAPGEEPPAEEG